MRGTNAFITRLESTGEEGRLAVKDNIDVEGVVTTCGSRLVSEKATQAQSDADCVKLFRAAGWTVVGKANLHELAYGATGVNLLYGTPRNPYDETLIPGGSSSGSAVAVGSGEADCALGTDSAGSVRMPAACCGVVGLKFSNGRVPMRGIVPLAPSLDSVGLLTRTVTDLAMAARALGVENDRGEPSALRVGRAKIAGIDESIDSAVDRALEAAGYSRTPLVLRSWEEGHRAARTIIAAEALGSISSLCLSLEGSKSQLGDDVVARLDAAQHVDEPQLQAAVATKKLVAGEVERIFRSFDVVCLPTLARPVPKLADTIDSDLAYLTAVVNLVGLPALAIPVPGPDGTVSSLQAIGRQGCEAVLLSFGRAIEKACGTRAEFAS